MDGGGRGPSMEGGGGGSGGGGGGISSINEGGATEPGRLLIGTTLSCKSEEEGLGGGFSKRRRHRHRSRIDQLTQLILIVVAGHEEEIVRHGKRNPTLSE